MRLIRQVEYVAARACTRATIKKRERSGSSHPDAGGAAGGASRSSPPAPVGDPPGGAATAGASDGLAAVACSQELARVSHGTRCALRVFPPRVSRDVRHAFQRGRPFRV